MALLTLTTDFGSQDFLAGAVKGRLLQADPQFRIQDITHSLSPFNFPQAAYVCRNSLLHFPEHTYHLVLVNLFDRPSDQLLLAFHHQQYILCADNGLLTMILEERPEMVVGLPIGSTREKNTIHYVDVMAKAILQLQAGESLQKIGNTDVTFIEKHPLRPNFSENWIEGQIIYIDNFENIILNITRDQFETHRKGRSFRIIFKRDEVIEKISENYSDVPEGEKVALFNAAGYLEIAINKGNAAGLFGLQGFRQNNASQQNRLFYQTARIFFD